MLFLSFKLDIIQNNGNYFNKFLETKELGKKIGKDI
jgi:hypothetical protein